jgi:hypothetical protein
LQTCDFQHHPPRPTAYQHITTLYRRPPPLLHSPAPMSSAARKVALLTGGAGFLGFHLTHKLLSEGYFVISVDNFCTGHRNNVAAYHGNPNYFFLQHDVSLPIPRDAHELMPQVTHSTAQQATVFMAFIKQHPHATPVALHPHPPPPPSSSTSISPGQRNLQHGVSRLPPSLPARPHRHHENCIPRCSRPFFITEFPY